MATTPDQLVKWTLSTKSLFPVIVLFEQKDILANSGFC